jgi:hypothetical protein
MKILLQLKSGNMKGINLILFNLFKFFSESFKEKLNKFELREIELKNLYLISNAVKDSEAIQESDNYMKEYFKRRSEDINNLIFEYMNANCV